MCKISALLSSFFLAAYAVLAATPEPVTDAFLITSEQSELRPSSPVVASQTTEDGDVIVLVVWEVGSRSLAYRAFDQRNLETTERAISSSFSRFQEPAVTNLGGDEGFLITFVEDELLLVGQQVGAGSEPGRYLLQLPAASAAMSPVVERGTEGTLLVGWQEVPDAKGIRARASCSVPDGASAQPVELAGGESCATALQVVPTSSRDGAHSSFLLVWQEEPECGAGGETFARELVFDERCQLVGQTPALYPYRMSPATGGIYRNPAVSASAIVWESEVDADTFIFLRRFVNGAIGFEMQVNASTAGKQSWPAIVEEGRCGAALVLWNDEERDKIAGQLLDLRTASFLGLEFSVSDGSGGAPGRPVGRPVLVALPEGRFVVVWETSVDGRSSLYGRFFEVPVEAACNDGTTLVLAERFEVRTSWWRRPAGPPKAARAIQLTESSGYFWFFGEGNVEVAVRVAAGCAGGEPCVEVLAGGLTSLDVELHITDRWTGAEQVYRQQPSASGLMSPIVDLQAFGSASASTTVERARFVPRGKEREGPLRRFPAPSRAEADGGSCLSAPGILCLRDRFRIRASWPEPPPVGSGAGLPLGEAAGYLPFQGDEPELVFKALDGCSINGNLWLFGAGLTARAVTVEVLDLETGTRRRFRGRPGGFEPFADLTSFPCEPLETEGGRR